MPDEEEEEQEHQPPEYGEPSFIGPCTCVHEPEQHGWGSCAIAGCECEAGWEE